MSNDIDVAIIGAGVVGLAVAAEIARRRNRNIFVLERNSSFGQETSSRNSEVIHAGIYYPGDSLKSRLCIEGNRSLYQLCSRYHIGYQRLGKLIVAISDEEIPALEALYQQGMDKGVTGLRMLSGDEVAHLEPCVRSVAGLLSPSTGIIDSHSLMRYWHQSAAREGVEFLFGAAVVGLEKSSGGWKVSVHDWEGVSQLHTRVVVNCAGLYADRIAGLAGIDSPNYRLQYCKGEYFSLNPRWRGSIHRLIYPVPEAAGLGIHITRSLDGMLRLGPNARYIPSPEYSVDPDHGNAFYEAVRRFIPSVEPADLQPAYAGVRPKLEGPDDPFRDFIMVHETEAGFDGLINLIGIDSPGLTAAPAIANRVADWITQIT